jgi:hypothetical protein
MQVRVPFWSEVNNSGFLDAPNVILGGDLNFTLSLWEVWGNYPHQDPQESFFHNLDREE